MQDVRACVRASIRIYSNIPRVPRRLLICIPAHLRICTSASTKRANFPARLHTGKTALLPASGRNRACPPPESAKLRDFFLHAATRWHSACYVRFKRNSRKFLQNFFAKNLVRVPKVRTFALANQKWGLQHLINLKQFDLWKHYIKLFCREVQETKWALFI